MSGYVSGSQFGVKAGIRAAIFVGLTLGFPFIVYGLIVATGARSVGGASGALAAVAGVYLKPIIVLGFAISLIGPCWRRMRSLGVPAFCGLLVPFLFLMDATYLLVVGAHWGTAFSLGIMKVNLPVFALIGLMVLVAMAFALPPSDDVAASDLFRRLGWACAILAVLLVVVALMTSSTILWFKLLTFNPRSSPVSALLPGKATSFAYAIRPFVCMAFCVAVVAMTILSRRNSSENTSGGSGDDPITPSPPPAPMNAGGVAFGKR